MRAKKTGRGKYTYTGWAETIVASEENPKKYILKIYFLLVFVRNAKFEVVSFI